MGSITLQWDCTRPVAFMWASRLCNFVAKNIQIGLALFLSEELAEVLKLQTQTNHLITFYLFPKHVLANYLSILHVVLNIDQMSTALGPKMI